MSISTDSTNSGDFSSDDCGNEKRGNEINYDELSIEKEEAVVNTNGESLTDQQKLKELSEKFAKVKLVLKITKLELKNKGLQEKLKQEETKAQLAKIEAENGKMKNEIEKTKAKMDEKLEQLAKNAEAENRKLTNEIEKIQEKFEKKEEKLLKNLEELQKKLVEMEHQQNEQKKSIEQMEKMLQAKCDAEEENRKLKNEQNEMKEKMDKLEEQLGRKLEKLDEELKEQFVTVQAKVVNLEMEHQKQKVSIDEIEKVQQNEQKRKFILLEKEQKETMMKMALLNFQQNCRDAKAFPNQLEITDHKSLTVIHKGDKNLTEFRTVFAIHPILFDKDSSGIFYFEISVKNMPNFSYGLFGFAVKQQNLEGRIVLKTGTYAYLSHGFF